MRLIFGNCLTNPLLPTPLQGATLRFQHHLSKGQVKSNATSPDQNLTIGQVKDPLKHTCPVGQVDKIFTCPYAITRPG